MIGGLLPGRYRISYQACGEGVRYVSPVAGLVAVRVGRPTTLGPVVLRPATSAGLIAASRYIAHRVNGADASRKPVISGSVTNSKGQRLSGICVIASSTSQNGNEASGKVTVTVTRKDGSYGLGSEVTAGRWIVQFLAGCGNTGNYAPQWWKFTSNGNKAKVLIVGKRSHFTGIDAKLVTGASVSGTVRGGSNSGTGLRGVCVDVNGVGPVSDVFAEVTTGKGGKYLVKGLGTGRYQLTFDPECGATGNFAPSNFPKDVAVKDGKTTGGVNWFVPVGGEIKGTVTSAASHVPVHGICVAAGGTTSDAGFGASVTGADGTYTIKGLSAGKYEVSFTAGCGNSGSFAPVAYNNQVSEAAADEVPVAAGQTVTGIDAAMPTGGIITGTVRDAAGHLLAGICVSVASTADEAPQGSTLASFAGLDLAGFANTKSGQYKVNNLLPGDYIVSFTSGCGRLKTSFAARWFAPQGGNGAAVVSVGSGTVRGINVKMGAPGTITGTVRAPGGKPAPQVCVLATGVSGQPPVGQLDDDLPETGKTGTYRITGLAPGKYQVAFAPCGQTDYAETWYKQAGSQASAKTLTVRAGHTTAGINQTMIVGTSISGRVTSASTHKPVARRCVLVLDPRGNLAGVAFTNADGDYSAGNLAPASYSVEVLACEGAAGGVANQVNDNVRVRRSQSVKGINFALPLAGSISGKVTGGSSAAPVAGACVVAETPRGFLFGPAFTRSNGTYVLGGLPPGQYGVTFSSLCAGSTGGFVDESLVSPVTVTSSATTSGVDGPLDADGGIAGTVQVSGSGAAGVCVIAFPTVVRGAPLVAVSAADGSYEINGAAPDSYRVEFTGGCGIAKYTTQWFNGATSRNTSTLVPVNAGTVSPGIDAH